MQTHINTSESCPFTGKTLKSIEIDLKKSTWNENTDVIHAKLDRKDENHIYETKYWSHDLFEKS